MIRAADECGWKIHNIGEFSCKAFYLFHPETLEQLHIDLMFGIKWYSFSFADHKLLLDSRQPLKNFYRPGLVNTKQQQGRSGMKARIQMVPLNRMAESDEIAGAVSYFLSESSAFVRGQVLSVSGGE